MGLGYIGLPTAAVAAKSGIEVIGVDINPDVVDTINRGEIHIVEPKLGEVVKEVVQQGNIFAKLVRNKEFTNNTKTPEKEEYDFCGVYK